MDGSSSGITSSAPSNAELNSWVHTPTASSSANPALLMAGGFGVQALGSFGSAYAQSQALQSQGAYQRQMFDFNQKVAGLQSQDALDRGDFAATREKQSIASTVGAERAGLAGQGVQVDSGSAAEIQENTKNIGAMNILTIKNNAWREAWGYQTQAVSYGAQGQFAGMAAENQAESTLLTGGLNSIGDVGKGLAAYQGSYSRSTPQNFGVRY